MKRFLIAATTLLLAHSLASAKTYSVTDNTTTYKALEQLTGEFRIMATTTPSQGWLLRITTGGAINSSATITALGNVYGANITSMTAYGAFLTNSTTTLATSIFNLQVALTTGAMVGGNTNYILNQIALQTNATLHITSATIDNGFTVNRATITNSARISAIIWDNGTVQTSSPLAGGGGTTITTTTYRRSVPGLLYASSAPFINIPFDGASFTPYSSTWVVTAFQISAVKASSSCSIMAYLAMSSGTPNAAYSRITPFAEISTATVPNLQSYSTLISTGFVVNAGYILQVSIAQANGCSDGSTVLCRGGCNGTGPYNLEAIIRADNPGGTP